MELIPSDALSFKFLDFGGNDDSSSSSWGTSSSIDHPYNDKFDDQSFSSVYLLENSQSNISNINTMIIVTALVIQGKFIVTKWPKKSYKIVNMAYECSYITL